MSGGNTGVSSFASFKPIEMVLASPIDPLMDSSCDTVDTSLELSAEMFYDPCVLEGSEMNSEGDSQTGRRPISEHQETDDFLEDHHRRVISPYPFSHTSQQEVEELEQLTNSCDWSLQKVRTEKGSAWGGKKISILVDYTRFLEFGGMAVDQVMDDDFSISSREAHSLSDDFCLSSISDNPASFWEECIDPVSPDHM
jgi:hypothetical protein